MFWGIYFSEPVIFQQLSSKAHLIIDLCVFLINKKWCISFGNLIFSENVVFRKKNKPAVNLLGQRFIQGLKDP